MSLSVRGLKDIFVLLAFSWMVGSPAKGAPTPVPVSSAVATGADSKPQLVIPSSYLSTQWMTMSPDGSLMATSHGGRNVIVWEVASGRQLRAFSGLAWRDGQGSGPFAAFAPDGRSLVTADNDTLKWWDLRSGQLQQTIDIEDQAATAVTVAPDGASIVVALLDRNRLKRFELASGREMAIYRGHSAHIHAVAFSPDGRTLVTGGADRTIVVWDAATGRSRATLKGHRSVVYSVAVSPNGHSIASASLDGAIGLWDTEQPEQVDEIVPKQGIVYSVAFSRDGRRLAAGVADQVMVWDVESGKRLSVVGRAAGKFPDDHGLHVGVAFASNDEVVGATRLDAVKWNVITGQPVMRFSASPTVNADRVSFADGGASLLIQEMSWDLEGSGAPALLAPRGGRLSSLCAVSADARYAAYESQGNVQVLDLKTRARSVSLPGTCDRSALAISPDGKYLAVRDAGTLSLRSVDGSRRLATLSGPVEKDELVRWAPDGASLLTAGERGVLRLWGTTNGRLIRSVALKGGRITSAAYAPDSSRIAVGNESGDVQVWSAMGGMVMAGLKAHREWVRGMAWTPDSQMVVSGGDDGVLKIWDVAVRRERSSISAHGSLINDLAISPDARTIVSTSYDGSTRLWRAMDGTGIATIVWLQNDHWAVIAPDGRFDASDLEEIGSLYWLLPSAPLSPLPIEALMREFYQPGLLSRLMKGVQTRVLFTLGNLNAAQPSVRILDATLDAAVPQSMKVTVEVTGLKRSASVASGTAAHDLRLFRDGQLVASVNGVLARQGDTPWRKTFDVAIPSYQSYTRVHFSAYAFSDERIKSETAKLQTDFQRAPDKHRSARAFILNVGVNQHDNPEWDLRFAANDAAVLQAALQKGLGGAGGYADVVAVKLASDREDRSATKGNVKAVLERLSGKTVSADLSRISNSERLATATPDDLVIITFAGHGHADSEGRFYLLMPDTGTATGKQFTDDLKKRSISSDELGEWLRDIDAGDIAMVVDACHSAASVDSGEFKPGPMGSKGLGQLAFDKGIRLLAASQADQAALESNRLAQGFLSFALASEGLDGFMADQGPKDGRIDIGEWLRYGLRRVPELARSLSGNASASIEAPRGAKLVSLGSSKAPPAQQPVLFDFRREARQVLIAVTAN